MKTFVIGVLAIFCVFVLSCRSRSQVQTNESIEQKEETAFLSRSLQREVDRFMDSMQSTDYKDWPVIHIAFKPTPKWANNTIECISMSYTLGYSEVEWSGYKVDIKEYVYFPYRDKLIGVSKRGSKYADRFIDSTKLIHSKEDFSIEGYCEPYLRVFEIIDTDSLSLVYDGEL